MLFKPKAADAPFPLYAKLLKVYNNVYIQTLILSGMERRALVQLLTPFI